MQLNLWRHLRILLGHCRQRTVTRILGHRIRYQCPTLRAHPTVIWDYGFRDLDAIRLGAGIGVEPHAEIVVRKRSPFSAVEGRLELGDGVLIATGANLRAAGGAIRIGARSGIGQFSVLIAANHQIDLGLPHFGTPWDETRTGVTIGSNVWIGAGCVILPGTVIGDNSVIAAGAIVRGTIPANELWGGTPARHIRPLRAPEDSA